MIWPFATLGTTGTIHLSQLAAPAAHWVLSGRLKYGEISTSLAMGWSAAFSSASSRPKDKLVRLVGGSPAAVTLLIRSRSQSPYSSGDVVPRTYANVVLVWPGMAVTTARKP